MLIDHNTRFLCQGMTGTAGSFHARLMKEYGTKIVAGVTLGKGGALHEGITVYDTALEAVEKTGAEASVIFVPAPFAPDAIMEAAEAGLRLIVCITEGIPIHDMLKVKRHLAQVGVTRRGSPDIIGPNCPGIIVPGESKIGIMPGYIHSPGPVAPTWARCLFTLSISWMGIPSVMQTIRRRPASAASIMASGAKGAGTNITLASAPVFSTASRAVS